MKKLVKLDIVPDDVIGVAKCDENKHYVSINKDTVCLLTRAKYLGKYAWSIIYSTAGSTDGSHDYRIGNVYGYSNIENQNVSTIIVIHIENEHTVYAFDKVIEAMKFIVKNIEELTA